jgi:hypothetical protein
LAVPASSEKIRALAAVVTQWCRPLTGRQIRDKVMASEPVARALAGKTIDLALFSSERIFS